MAFRQECSSGRLVGFLWAVFTPAQVEERLKASGPIPFAERIMNKPHKSDGPQKSAHVVQPPSTPPAEHLVDADQPSADDQGISPRKTARASGPPAHPPPAEASALILPAKHYARINRLLLHLDYANLDIAAESSERWIDDVGICAGKQDWGFEVVGEKELDMGGNSGGGEATGVEADGKGVEGVNTLDVGLMRKKRRVEGNPPGENRAEGNGTDGADGGVNVLATGLVRKKPKIK